MVNKVIDSLERLALSHVPNAVMAFWGGSRAMGGALPNSDYDMVVLAPQIEKPISYNYLTNPLDGRQVDMIVRDPETLAFELLDAKQCGKVTVPRMIAEGKVVFGNRKKAAALKKQMQDFVAKGPDALSRNTYRMRYQALERDFSLLEILEPQAKTLLSFELMHEMGDFFLRSEKQWTAAGKIIGRYLMPHDFKNDLEIGYQKKDLRSVFNYFSPDPDEFKMNENDIVLEKALNEPDQKLKSAFLVRYWDRYLYDAMREDTKTATDYLGNKLFSVSCALDKRRIGRPSNEYFYALSRVVITMAKAVEIITGSSHDIRYAALDYCFPQFYSDVKEAENGQPDKLRNFVNNIALVLNPEIGKPSTRLSPTTFRSEANAFKTLIK